MYNAIEFSGTSRCFFTCNLIIIKSLTMVKTFLTISNGVLGNKRLSNSHKVVCNSMKNHTVSFHFFGLFSFTPFGNLLF